MNHQVSKCTSEIFLPPSHSDRTEHCKACILSHRSFLPLALQSKYFSSLLIHLSSSKTRSDVRPRSAYFYRCTARNYFTSLTCHAFFAWKSKHTTANNATNRLQCISRSRTRGYLMICNKLSSYSSDVIDDHPIECRQIRRRTTREKET